MSDNVRNIVVSVFLTIFFVYSAYEIGYLNGFSDGIQEISELEEANQ